MTFDGATAGPGMNEGSTFVSESGNCQIRTVRCAGEEGSTFDISVGSQFPHIERECGSLGASGIHQHANGCVIVETRDNPIESRKRSTDDRTSKAVRRSELEQLDVQRRQCNGASDGKCYRYTELTFVTNVRGDEVRVCDNVLPDKARCDQTRSTTISQSFSIGVDVGAGIKDIVEVTGSFSMETGTANTESLNTAITVDCPGGEGYVVWYPFFEVSRGDCYSGDDNACDEDICVGTERSECEMWRPIMSGLGKLSGEYDVQCI